MERDRNTTHGKGNRPDRSNDQLIETDVIGKIKWTDPNRGFGFINFKAGDIDQDLFFHYSDIIGHKSWTCKINDIVMFDIMYGTKGLYGKEVQLLERSDDSPSDLSEDDVKNKDTYLIYTDVTGIVGKFYSQHGYGFIKSDIVKEGIFFHQSAIADGPSKKYEHVIQDNDEVIFELWFGLKGYRAKNVRLLVDETIPENGKRKANQNEAADDRTRGTSFGYSKSDVEPGHTKPRSHASNIGRGRARKDKEYDTNGSRDFKSSTYAGCNSQNPHDPGTQKYPRERTYGTYTRTGSEEEIPTERSSKFSSREYSFKAETSAQNNPRAPGYEKDTGFNEFSGASFYNEEESPYENYTRMPPHFDYFGQAGASQPKERKYESTKQSGKMDGNDKEKTDERKNFTYTYKSSDEKPHDGERPKKKTGDSDKKDKPTPSAKPRTTNSQNQQESSREQSGGRKKDGTKYDTGQSEKTSAQNNPRAPGCEKETGFNGFSGASSYYKEESPYENYTRVPPHFGQAGASQPKERKYESTKQSGKMDGNDKGKTDERKNFTYTYKSSDEKPHDGEHPKKQTGDSDKKDKSTPSAKPRTTNSQNQQESSREKSGGRKKDDSKQDKGQPKKTSATNNTGTRAPRCDKDTSAHGVFGEARDYKEDKRPHEGNTGMPPRPERKDESTKQSGKANGNDEGKTRYSTSYAHNTYKSGEDRASYGGTTKTRNDG